MCLSRDKEVDGARVMAKVVGLGGVFFKSRDPAGGYMLWSPFDAAAE